MIIIHLIISSSKLEQPTSQASITQFQRVRLHQEPLINLHQDASFLEKILQIVNPLPNFSDGDWWKAYRIFDGDELHQRPRRRSWTGRRN
jgi:hypothetical protein